VPSTGRGVPLAWQPGAASSATTTNTSQRILRVRGKWVSPVTCQERAAPSAATLIAGPTWTVGYGTILGSERLRASVRGVSDSCKSRALHAG
jgi:hypothetical protein